MDPMEKEKFFENLLSVYPYWQYDVMRPFIYFYKGRKCSLSLENYYCIQIIRWFDGITMSQLAERLTMSKQQLSLKVNKLVVAGYLRREQDENDRRIVKLYATAQAEEETDAQYEYCKGFVDLLRQKLSDEDMAQMNTAMETVLQVLPKLEE